MSATKPAFRRMLADLSDGTVLKPLLHSYLFNAEFPGIDLHLPKVDSHSLAYGPDGWFHPSTHPLWPERKLYYYLTEPEKLIAEDREYMGTLSLTMGKVMHKFVQICLSHMGVLVRPTMKEILNDSEPAAIDESTRARGNFDGELNLSIPSHPELTRQLFEFKTRSPRATVIDDLDLVAFKAKYPGYYAQVQEYMRMEGLRLTVVLLFSMGFPWEMTEIHVPYDPAFAQGVADKYRSVLLNAESKTLPPPCCSPGSKEARACEARLACPHGG